MADQFSDVLANFNAQFVSLKDQKIANAVAAQQAKSASLQEMAQAKSLVHSSEDYMRTVATAFLEGNELAQTPLIQDMVTMSDPALATKYGYDVAQNRFRLSKAINDIRREKSIDRTAGELAQDGSLAAADGLAQMGLGAASLAAQGADALLQLNAKAANALLPGDPVSAPAPLAPHVSQAAEWVSQQLSGLYSDTGKQQIQQHSRESQLDAQDRQATYDRAIQRGDGVALATARQFGSAITDTIGNMIDNPGVAFNTGANAAGSLVGFGVAARIAGKAGALNEMMQAGMTRTAAEEALTTAAGKQLVMKHATAFVPKATAVTEGGTAVMQAQQDIMNMPDAELSAIPEYQAYLKEGLRPDQARAQLASDAGNVAGTLGTVAGFFTGQIAKGFEAAPFSLGTTGKAFGASVRNGAVNVAKESGEEFLQAGTTQLATNIGKDAAGVDTPLLKDVAEQATMEAIGGFMSAGATQAPGVALGSAKETAILAGQGLSKAFTMRNNALEAANAASSPVNAENQAKAVTEAQTIVSEMAPQADGAAQTSYAGLVQDAVQAPEEDVVVNATVFPELKQAVDTHGPKLTKFQYIEALGQTIGNKDTEDGLRNNAAIILLDTVDSLQSVNSEEIDAALQGLDKADAAHGTHQALNEKIGVLAQSDAVTSAREIVSKLTKDSADAIFHLNKLNEEDLDSGLKTALISMAQILARHNLDAVRPEYLKMSADQLNPKNKQLKRSLELAHEIALEFQTSAEQKQKVHADASAAIEQLPAAERADAQAKLGKTVASVREEVRITGNSTNDSPSLLTHFNNISQAFRSKQPKAGALALQELGRFAQSMANKIGALNQSIAQNGKPVGYSAYNPTQRKFFNFERGSYAQAASPTSMAFAKFAYIDAQATIRLYNAMLKAFGDQIPEGMTLAPIELGQVDARISVEGAATAAVTQQSKSDQSTAQQSNASTQDAQSQQTPTQETNTTKATADTQTQTTSTEATATTAPTTEKPVDSAPVEKTPAPKLTETFSNLAHSAQNMFLKAFKRREEPRSTLPETERPLQHVRDTMRKVLTKEQADDLEQTILSFVPVMKRLNALANGVMHKKSAKGVSLLDQFQFEGKNPLTYLKTRAANLLIQKEDGSYEFDPRVLSATMMAIYEWIQTEGQSFKANLDNEDVAKALGLPRGSNVTNEMRAAVQSGKDIFVAINSISAKLAALLDVKENTDVSASFTQGILRSMVITALMEMDAGTGALVQTNKYMLNGDQKTFTTLTVPKSEGSQKSQELFKGIPDVFSRMFLKNKEKLRYIGEAPSKALRTKAKDRTAKLSSKEVKAVDRIRNTVYKINAPVIQAMKAVSPDVVLDLLGRKVIDEKSMNKNDMESAVGKNTSLNSGWSGFLGYEAEIEAYAKENGITVEEAEVFFDAEVTSTGRIQQVGPVTPQGSKVMRELVTATNAVVDLTKKKMEGLFWLAAAQAADIKIAKVSHIDAVLEAKDLFTRETGLKPAVDLLEKWLANPEKPMTAKQQDAFSKAVSAATMEDGSLVEFTMKLFHAMVDVARYNTADTKGRKAFKTSMAIEADGVTDGPINAMIHMLTGAFTQDQVDAFAMGGLYFRKTHWSLNDFAQQKKKRGSAIDLYGKAASLLEQKILTAFKEGKADSGLLPSLSLAHALLDGLKFKDGVLTIGRGVTKNPLTVLVYGSSDAGISGKLVGQMTHTFYSVMSSVAEQIKAGQIKSWQDHAFFQENPSFVSDFAAVFGMPENHVKAMLLKPVEATIPHQALQTAAKTLSSGFTQHLAEAINEVTGGLVENMRMAQLASQVQAAVFKAAFETALVALKDKRVAEGKLKKSEALSADDVQAAFDEVKHLAPIYETDAQSFNIAAKERGNFQEAVATDLGSESLKLGGTRLTPSDASVKVSPYTVIGAGDGRMVLNIYTNSDGSLDTSLPVYDGIELSIDTIMDGSKQINEAVFNAWMDTNIFRALHETMSRINDPEILRNLPKEAATLLKQNKTSVSGLLRNLSHAADQVSARKMAIRKMHTWTDHMASAMAPHENAGAVVRPSQIVETLNKFFHEALYAEQDTSNVIEKPDETLQAAIEKHGTKVEGTGITQILGSKIPQVLFDGSTDKTSLSAWMLDVFRRFTKFSEYAFYFGSAEELTKLQETIFPGQKLSPVQHGRTLVHGRAVFVSNVALETLSHELLHTLTADTLLRYFAAPEKASQLTRDAIKRLEALKERVLHLNVDQESEEVQAAVAVLHEALQSTAHHPAAQISELISWTLTNQKLIGILDKTEANSFLARVGKRVLDAVKTILGITAEPGYTLFTNIRFNAEIIMAEKPLTQIGIGLSADEASDVFAVLEQSLGENANMDRIERLYNTQRLRFLRENTGNTKAAQAAIDADIAVRELIDRAQQNGGYSLNEREALAFRTIYSTIRTGIALNPSALRRLNRLYRHAMDNLSPESFLEDPAKASQADKVLAEHLYGFLVNHDGMRDPTYSAKDGMAAFIALAQTSPELREALLHLEAPKDVALSYSTFDEAVESFGQTIVNWITRVSAEGISLRRQGADAQAQIDQLTEAMLLIENDSRTLASMLMRGADRADVFVRSKTDKLNEVGSKALQSGAKKVTGALQNKAASTQNKYAKAALNVASYITALGNEELYAGNGEALTSFLNKTAGFDAVRALVRDLRGTTESTKDVYKLLNRVRSEIDAMRQKFRTNTPKHLAEFFSRKLSKTEWAHTYETIGKADLLALGQEAAKALAAKPETVVAEIKAAEEAITQLDATRAVMIFEKAEALSRYMMWGEVTSNHLLKNAKAIATLTGSDMKQDASEALIDAVDRLVTLYAFQKSDEAAKNTLKELALTEGKGVDTLLGFTATTRAAELSKNVFDDTQLGAEMASLNALKGYIPAEFRSGMDIVVADASDHSNLLKMGYKRGDRYDGDPNERYAGVRYYYIATVGTKAAYRQGIAQSVHSTFMGVDSRNGRLRNGGSVGTVGSHQEVAKILNRRGAENDSMTAGDHLMPVFNADGQLVAYERPISPEYRAKKERRQHMGNALGQWFGRIQEEQLADDFNVMLIQRLKDMYDHDYKRRDEYVNIADPKIKDKVYKDAWDTMGWRLKQNAADVFGERNFMPVRREMIDDAFGYRAATVVDAFTGITRWSEQSQKTMRDVFTFFLGNNAYKYPKLAFDITSEVVGYAKKTVVVRSINVSLGNMSSNYWHLMTYNIGHVPLLKGLKNKFVEISEYTKHMEDIARIDVELSSQIGRDTRQVEKLLAKKASLEEAISKLTILPLIEAGEFNTIAEDQSEVDSAIRETRLGEYIGKQYDKLPKGLQTAANNLLVSEDTAIYKALNRSVQYGDFIAKAVLYDHLTQKRGMAHEDALEIIREEFVNYNKLPGRTRGFLEQIGALWFMNYSTRIMKIAASTIRNRPFTALQYAIGPHALFGVDTVVDSNLVGKILDGSAGYSVGPDMVTQIVGLNPWYNSVK